MRTPSLTITAASTMLPPNLLLTLLLIVLQASREASAHGTMIDPVSRNSLWKIDSTAPVNYNDIELFCGGIGGITRNNGKCGLCGDAYDIAPPRPHETGGRMAVNKTVRNFFPGSSIDIMIDLSTNHGGYFEFELCKRDSFEEPETEACFRKLKFPSGSTRLYLSRNHSERGLISYSLQAPADIQECRACVLRWNYKAGNNWGICKDGTSGPDCGPQELYRNCADISIGHFSTIF